MAALNMYEQAILQGYGPKIFKRMSDMFRGLQIIRGHQYTHVVMPKPYSRGCLLHRILMAECYQDTLRGNPLSSPPRISDNLILENLSIVWSDDLYNPDRPPITPCLKGWMRLSRTDADSLFEGVPTEKEYMKELQKTMERRDISAALQQEAARQAALNQQQALYNSSLQAQMANYQSSQYAQEQYREMQQRLNDYLTNEQNRMKPQPVTREMFPHPVAQKEIPGVGWVKIIKIPSAIQGGERFEVQFTPWVDPKKTGGKMFYQQYKWYQRRPKPFLTPVFSPLKTMLNTALWITGLMGLAWVGVKLSPLVQSFFEQVVLP